MSMNLHLSGEREVTVVKTGKTVKQSVSFDLYQTPTTVTNAALISGNPKAAYVEYVMRLSKDVQEPVYAVDDIFCVKDPIGFTTFNSAIDHLKELEDFLSMCKDEGYEIEFYEM